MPLPRSVVSGVGPGNLGKRLREEDVPAARMHGHVDADHPRDARRARPCRVDDDGRGDVALGRPHGARREVDCADLDALDDRGAELARAAREAVRDFGGARHAVAGTPHGGDEVVDLHRGHDRLRFLRRDHADVDAQIASAARCAARSRAGPPPP